MHLILEYNQPHCLKPYIEFNTHKRIEAEKNGDRDGKALYKLMNNAIYRKTIENFRNRVNVRLVNNEKDYWLKWTSQPNYMLHKIFDNNLVTTRKSKVAVKLNKPAYIGMFILELSEVLMYKFHYDYIKSKNYNKSRLWLTGTNSLMYEIKTEDVYKDFRSDKDMLHFSNYSAKSKYYNDINKLVIGKTKDENGGVLIEEFVWFCC